MRTITIPNDAIVDQYGDSITASREYVLALKGTYHRFGIGAMPRGREARQVNGGPMVPGPWAYAFGLATVLCANPAISTGNIRRANQAAGTEFDVEAGDRLIFDDVEYEIQVDRGTFLNLVKVRDLRDARSERFQQPADAISIVDLRMRLLETLYAARALAREAIHDDHCWQASVRRLIENDITALGGTLADDDDEASS